jgi:hypothetical protein
VDLRTVNMVATGVATNGTNHLGIINHPDEVGGYPVIAVVTRPANWDTDQDGMPDTWETQHGLNPNHATDRNGDFDSDGYTNLEEYLNELGAFKAVQDVVWDGELNNRYAQIENWDLAFQPSRFDTAIISNATVIVDAIGQHAGILKLTNNAALNITNGWLNVATRFENGIGCTTLVSGNGSLTTSNLVNTGTLRLTGNAGLNVTGSFTNTGTLDVMTWNGTLPGGFVNLGTILDRGLIVMTAYGVSGTNFTATIPGYAGHNYQLQYRDELTSGSWQNVGSPVAGANGPIVVTHPNGAGPQQRFYRMRVD